MAHLCALRCASSSSVSCPSRRSAHASAVSVVRARNSTISRSMPTCSAGRAAVRVCARACVLCVCICVCVCVGNLSLSKCAVRGFRAGNNASALCHGAPHTHTHTRTHTHTHTHAPHLHLLHHVPEAQQGEHQGPAVGGPSG